MPQPTGTTGATKPWSPLAIALLSLLISPVAGGVLHGLNYGKLGRPGLRRFVLARNLLAALLFLLFYLQRGFGVSILGALFFAAYFYKTQEEPFQEHLSQGGTKGSAFVAFLIALLVTVPLVLMAVVLSIALSP